MQALASFIFEQLRHWDQDLGEISPASFPTVVMLFEDETLGRVNLQLNVFSPIVDEMHADVVHNQHIF